MCPLHYMLVPVFLVTSRLDNLIYFDLNIIS